MYRLINEVQIQTNAIEEIRTKATHAGLMVTGIVLKTAIYAPEAYKDICNALECVTPVHFPNNTIVMDFEHAVGGKKVIFDGEDTFKTYLKISND